jgi:hypothetical protein
MSTPPSSDPAAAASSDAGLPALERLRGRIEAATAEIERLRSANAALAERVQELAAADVARTDDAVPTLTLEGDPDELRKKVEAFIEAIDRMLAEPATRETPAETEAAETNGEPSSESAG